jgi:hypothetical protein
MLLGTFSEKNVGFRTLSVVSHGTLSKNIVAFLQHYLNIVATMMGYSNILSKRM